MLLSSFHLNGERCGASCRVAFLLLSGLTFPAASAVAAWAQPMPFTSAVPNNSFDRYIADAAERFGIPKHWIVAVLRAESAGEARAISSAGAMGLMQIMPVTWDELRVRYRLGPDPFDVRDNIHAGAGYLREMFDRYGNVAAMLAAYNAGPGRYDEYLASGRILPAETRAYVAALAPVLGAESVPDFAVAEPSAPPDWRESPLFVARGEPVTGAADAPSPAPPPDHLGEDVPPPSLPYQSLFVERAGGSPQ